MSRFSSFPTTVRARALAATVALFAGRSLHAQPQVARFAQVAQLAPADSVLTPSASGAPVAPAGPTLAAAAVAARPTQADRRPTSAEARAAVAPRAHHGQAAALMIVGGAAVVLGILVGGDAQTPLVVGGAVVGLIGLYQYLL
ncbi:hypothetical protein J421_4224 [Gemmatirosa kalamazoonensis]|uniref:Uncharacterized protein n=1 Tax=Gemmatirosa kalamazoonensis TaxID=861299 RepID=W0RLY9_9BACT|nr:hypothetical protein [Gemmatirosa kalamazoonensis]AHG91761.1 hypothetical protein J421_4224 [Gemmatirosa kalamazoonensis]